MLLDLFATVAAAAAARSSLSGREAAMPRELGGRDLGCKAFSIWLGIYQSSDIWLLASFACVLLRTGRCSWTGRSAAGDARIWAASEGVGTAACDFNVRPGWCAVARAVRS